MLTERIDTTLDLMDGDTHLVGHDLLTSEIVGDELMERGVKETDIHGASIHSLEDAVEVLLLVGEELSQCLLTSGLGICQDHLTHGFDLLVFEEHMLCTTQTNTDSSEGTSHCSIVGRIGIGADDELGVLLTDLHQVCEVPCDLCGLSLYLTEVDFAGAPVERQIVALLEYDTVDLYRTTLVVDIDSTCT